MIFLFVYSPLERGRGVLAYIHMCVRKPILWMFFTHPLTPLERGEYILYHQVKERREKRNSRNHLFRDYGSKGRGREAHLEFLVVWVV